MAPGAFWWSRTYSGLIPCPDRLRWVQSTEDVRGSLPPGRGEEEEAQCRLSKVWMRFWFSFFITVEPNTLKTIKRRYGLVPPPLGAKYWNSSLLAQVAVLLSPSSFNKNIVLRQAICAGGLLWRPTMTLIRKKTSGEEFLPEARCWEPYFSRKYVLCENTRFA